MANYRNSQGGGSMMIIIVLVVLTLAAVGFALWYYMGSSSTADVSPVVANQTSTDTPSDSDSDSPSSEESGGKIYGPIDDIGDDRNKILGAYSIRHLYSKYDGPIFRIRRVSGGGSQQAEDVFQKTKGGPLTMRDGKKLTEWLGTIGGEVTIWYDQYNEKHITPQSGYPKIILDPSMSGKDSLEFKNTKIRFDNEETKPVNMSKYPNLKIISNVDIFKGPMEDRIMDGTITDLYFLSGNIESGAIDMLETSKKPLKVLNPDPNIDSSSGTSIKVLLGSRDIQVTNQNTTKINLYVNGKPFKTGLGKGNHNFTNQPEVKPGAKIAVGTAPDKILARADVPYTVTKATLKGDIKVKSLYVSGIEPTGAVVNVYVKGGDGKWTAIKTGVTRSTMSQSITVPGMQRTSIYGVGPTPEVIVSEWSPMYDETN